MINEHKVAAELKQAKRSLTKKIRKAQAECDGSKESLLMLDQMRHNRMLMDGDKSVSKTGHKVHGDEKLSDVTGLRGIVAGRSSIEIEGFTVEHIKDRAALLITQDSTGKQHEVGYYASKEVCEALKAFTL